VASSLPDGALCEMRRELLLRSHPGADDEPAVKGPFQDPPTGAPGVAQEKDYGPCSHPGVSGYSLAGTLRHGHGVHQNDLLGRLD